MCKISDPLEKTFPIPWVRKLLNPDKRNCVSHLSLYNRTDKKRQSSRCILVKKIELADGLDTEYETKKEDQNAINIFDLSNWREELSSLKYGKQ